MMFYQTKIGNLKYQISHLFINPQFPLKGWKVLEGKYGNNQLEEEEEVQS